MKVALHISCVCICLIGNASMANEFYQLGLNVGNEDNLPRGFDPSHQLDASFFQANLSAGKFLQLGLNDSLSVSAKLETTRYDQLKGFDTVLVSQLISGTSLDSAPMRRGWVSICLPVVSTSRAKLETVTAAG